jgi:DNA invertase Pin-like site-specific DNA recombinase
MTRAALYARVSSEMQADNWSTEAQLDACRKLAADRGWEVVAEYTDVESAKTTARPSFQHMLASAKGHGIDVIIVHKLDRFSRSVIDTLRLLQELHALDVGFVSASENIDFSSPMGKMMLTMLASFAEYFIDNLSQETAKGKRRRAENGHWNSAVPFGYDVPWLKDAGDGIPRVNEAEAAVANILRSFTLPDDWRNQVLEQPGAMSPEVTAAEARRRRIDNQLERLKALYRLGDIEQDQYKRERDELSASRCTQAPRHPGRGNGCRHPGQLRHVVG